MQALTCFVDLNRAGSFWTRDHLLPGDPARTLVGVDAPPETVNAVRHDMGLDQPLTVQYGVWLARVVRGDLSRSILTGEPVAGMLAARIPASLQLAAAAMFLSLLIALPAGMYAATHQRGAVDWVISSLCSLGVAVPTFWLGIMGIILFAVVLGWLPPGGPGDITRDPAQFVKSMMLPRARSPPSTPRH